MVLAADCLHIHHFSLIGVYAAAAAAAFVVIVVVAITAVGYLKEDRLAQWPTYACTATTPAGGKGVPPTNSDLAIPPTVAVTMSAAVTATCLGSCLYE